MSERERLAQMCEQAHEGSRELGAKAIAALVGEPVFAAVSPKSMKWQVFSGHNAPKTGHWKTWPTPDQRGMWDDLGRVWRRGQYPTESLDAAREMLRDGWAYTLISADPVTGRAYATATFVGLQLWTAEAAAATPELALVAAALRAEETYHPA